MAWPPQLPVARVRFARHVDDLEAVLPFYERDLGLRRIASFRGHEGYDGVILGLPDERVQLELTQGGGRAPPRPAEDDLLVLYFESRAARDAVAARLRAAGRREVEAANPWWRERAVVFEDPAGGRVVLSDA